MMSDRPPATPWPVFTEAQRGMLRYAAQIADRARAVERINHTPFADVVAHGIALAACQR